MRPNVIPAQASVRIPRPLPWLERPIFANKPHVLRQAGVVAVHKVPNLVRAGTQKLVCLLGMDVGGGRGGLDWGGGDN